MFNSPPPGFIRPPPGPPPLLNPNFFPTPNRFWGNAPPTINMNQNKTMQQSNRWSTPPNFERQQRFNRPPPDFGMESRTNRRSNDDVDEDDGNNRDDDQNSKDGDNVGEDLENFDESPVKDENSDGTAVAAAGTVNQPEQSGSNQTNSAPKRQNPFSRNPTSDDTDFGLNNSAKKANNISRPLCDDTEQQQRFNTFPSNNQQSPAFNRNTNPNQQFNSQNFNNQIGQFNQTPTGPQPLFSPQNMNFNSPMRGGRGGGIRNDSPYFRPRGRGGPPGMLMNRGNFRPNFRGNNNRGSW